MIYCVIPAGRETELAEPLRAQFTGIPQVEVIVERRTDFVSAENAERRKISIPRQRWLSPELAASGIKFEQRLATVTARLADEPGDVLARLAAGGDADAATELYWRWYEYIEVRIQEHLKTRRTNPRLALAAFGRVLDAVAENDRARFSLDQLIDTSVKTTVGDHMSARRELASEAKSWLRVAA